MYINTITVYMISVYFLYVISLLLWTNCTPYGTENNHKDIALHLIEHGCSVDVKNYIGIR